MQSQKYSTRAIVEAGLISTLMAALMLMTVNLPLFSRLSTLILPIPIAILCVRHNYSVAAGAVFTSGVLIGMLYSPVAALINAVMFGIAGMTLGYCLKAKKGGWYALTLVAAAVAAATMIDMALVLTFVYKMGFVEFISQSVQMFRDSMEKAYDFYRQSGFQESQIKQIQEAMGIFTADYVVQLLPTSLALLSFGFSYLILLFTEMILKRLQYEVVQLQPFSTLYINNRIGTVLLLFVIAGALMNNSGIAIGNTIAGASRYLVGTVLVIDGTALAAHYLRNRFGLTKLVTGIIIVLTVTTPVFLLFYTFAGLADMILDFRKLDPFRRKTAH
ncbi:MAG: YybS family protein [Clostridiaceae bacterium]